MQHPPATGEDRHARVLLALGLVLGLLRFVRLGEWSLWIDEALTWADVHHGIEGGQIRNPAGYWWIAWTVERLGGVPDEFSLRLLPAIAGWLCIPAAFLAFRGTFGERRAALVSLLVAVSSWHVYWSQNARFYTFAQLVALAGVGLALAGLRRGTVVVAIAGFAVTASAALLHASAALLLPALVLAPWVLQRLRQPIGPSSSRPAAALALVGVAGGLSALGWAHGIWDTYAYQKGQGGTLGAALASMAHFVKTAGFYVTPLLFTAVACGAWVALRGRRGPERLALATVVSALALALVASAFVRVSAQYVFVLFPWIALLASLPLGPAASAPGPLGRRGEAVYAALLVLPALVTTGLYLTVRHGERPQWRAAFQHVANERQPGEPVFGMEASVGEFYLARWNTDLRRPTALSWLDYFHPRGPERASRLGERGWYVINPEQFLGWDPHDAAEFQRFLREECRLVRAWPLYVESRDLSVWVYRRD